MQFNSLQFIFYFLPPMLLVYYLTPRSRRAFVLALGSLLYYWLASGKKLYCLVVLLALTAVSFGFGIALENRKNRWLLAAAVAVPAGTLVFFKYFGSGRLLPPGLSFYTFTVIAYTVDVYRNTVPANRNAVAYCCETAMFPKLISGPLAESGSIRQQMRSSAVSPDDFHGGLQDMIVGLSMKVLLADRVGGLWRQAGVIGYEYISTPFAWMALLSFCMRLYFDFWGYSIMATGLGKMLGYTLPDNFLQPYSARSVSEFYRRWHVTLGAWFRKYIYIPLGGNRKGLPRTLVNLAVVWLLTGLWHGISAGYLVWGIFLFSFIALERVKLGDFLQKHPVLSHFYTVIVIMLSFVPFAAETLSSTGMIFGRLFGIGGIHKTADVAIWGKPYIPMLAVCVLFATPLPMKLWEKIRNYAVTDIAVFALFLASVYFMSTAAQDPFMYFQF